MIRENYLSEGIIKEFNNHNLHIKFNPGYIEDIKAGKYSEIEVLSWILDTIDTYYVGDNFCLSNWDEGVMLWNAYSDRVYTIAFSDIDNILMGGHVLRLIARKPGNEERELINQEFEILSCVGVRN